MDKFEYLGWSIIQKEFEINGDMLMKELKTGDLNGEKPLRYTCYCMWSIG